MGFFENWGEGYVEGAEMMGVAGDQFAEGNIVGGLFNGTLGFANWIGNTITFGGAHALGNLAEESIREDSPDVMICTLDGRYGLCGDVLYSRPVDENGNVDMYGKWTVDETVDPATLKFDGFVESAPDAKFNLLQAPIAAMAASNASAYNLAANGHDGLANTISAIDTASFALDVATTYTLVGAPVAGFVSGAGKNFVKSIAKNGVANTVKTAAKTGVATLGTAAQKTFAHGFKTGIKKTAKNAATKVATAGGTLLGTSLASQATRGSNVAKYASEIKEDGLIDATVRAGTDMVEQGAEQIVSTAKDTGEVVKDIADGALAMFMKGHHNIAKFVNTCRAAVKATGDSISKSTVGSYVTSVCSVAADKVTAWVGDGVPKYRDKSVGDLANDIKQTAISNSGVSWRDSYIKYVTDYDQDWDVKTHTRTILVNPQSQTSAEPSLSC